MQVKKILKYEKPDIVHSQSIPGFSNSIISATSSLGIPHVHTLHNYGLLSPWGNLFRRGKVIDKLGILDIPHLRLSRLFTRGIQAVIGPSHFILDLHLRYGLFKKAKRYVIPNGFSMISDLMYSTKDYESLDILFVGELSENKGLQILLNAFVAINKANVNLHIVGGGPLAKWVSALASQDNRIKYHGCLSRGELLWQLYSKANLLVVPSVWFENLPTVVIEAFSYATPVIGSAIGGIPEMVEDGYNGLLFKPGDVCDLRGVLEKGLSDIELLKKLGKNAKKSYQRYNLPFHMENLMKVYEHVL
jgi:glycosyltransferase involved in cell wall biosynthesis